MPVKTNGYSNRGRLERKELKRLEGEERLLNWRSLTPMQQIAELDKRPGESKKQRARILAKFNSLIVK